MTNNLKRPRFWYSILFGCFCFFLSFEGVARAVPNILLIPLTILLPIVFKKEKFLITNWLPIILYSTIWFVLLVKTIFLNQVKVESGFLIKLFLVPVIFFLVHQLDSTSVIKKGIVYGTTFSILISLASIVAYVFDSGSFEFSSGPLINKVLVTERVYLAFMAVISSIFCFELIEKPSNSKWAYSVLVFLNVLFVLLVAARMATLILLTLGILYFLYHHKYKQLVFFGVVSMIVLATFVMFNPNLKNRFFFADKSKSFVDKVKVWEPRVAIWGCTFSVMYEKEYNFIFGFDTSQQLQENLVGCYADEIESKGKSNYFVKSRFNTHNQFFDFLLLAGVSGFLIFLFLFLKLGTLSKDNYFLTSLVLAFFMFGVVENYLHRQLGVYLFGIFLGIMARDKESKSN